VDHFARFAPRKHHNVTTLAAAPVLSLSKTVCFLWYCTGQSPQRRHACTTQNRAAFLSSGGALTGVMRAGVPPADSLPQASAMRSEEGNFFHFGNSSPPRRRSRGSPPRLPIWRDSEYFRHPIKSGFRIFRFLKKTKWRKRRTIKRASSVVSCEESAGSCRPGSFAGLADG
jgi:hypothetical protein